ncbi:MAG: hypothetical protein WCO33_03695 [bacterium]
MSRLYGVNGMFNNNSSSLQSRRNYGVDLAYLYNFFKSKNALSPENAVDLTEDDCLSIGIPYPANFYLVSSVKKTGSGKFWFSKETYNKVLNRTLILGKVVLVIFGIVFTIITSIILVVAFIFVRTYFLK